jgi:N-methylhydantoinase A
MASVLAVAADVGGTFTDLILVDSARNLVLVDKVSSGARGTAGSIVDGLARITGRSGARISDIDLFVHGFTVATNAFLMRSGARVALVTTKGFADVLHIGNQVRPQTYALFQNKPAPLADRSMVVEVDERIDAQGGIVRALDARAIADTVAKLRALGADAVAISLVFSFLNDTHEAQLAEAIRAALPDCPVYASHHVNPQQEEWPRASTTAITAYLGPIVGRYLDDLETRLAGETFRGSLRLMRSDGGVATPRAARLSPGHTLTSGLAGGVMAATRLCADLNLDQAITLDVGGTSADHAVITGGEPGRRTAGVLDGQPIRLPAIDVDTLSNGGGSIAWVDIGGALRVGPLSAGAVPGPACTGRGGSEPTVTDAALVLGWLGAEDYLGGEIKLDVDLARAAIGRHVAENLGISIEAAAQGIIRVANAQLAQAFRAITSSRGLDLRDFHLVAFGGAGPLYGGMLTRELGMRGVVVPHYPGVFAAEGLLATDIRHVDQRAFRALLDQADRAALAAALASLRTALARELEADGVPPDRRRFTILMDLRYRGQFHELAVAVPQALVDDFDAQAIAGLFHDRHQATFGHSDRDRPVEIVNLRAEMLGEMGQVRPPEAAAETADAAPDRRRDVLFLDSPSAIPVPVVHRATVNAKGLQEGPAIIVQRDSTTVLLAGQVARVAARGALIVTEIQK